MDESIVELARRMDRGYRRRSNGARLINMHRRAELIRATPRNPRNRRWSAEKATNNRRRRNSSRYGNVNCCTGGVVFPSLVQSYCIWKLSHSQSLESRFWIYSKLLIREDRNYFESDCSFKILKISKYLKAWILNIFLSFLKILKGYLPWKLNLSLSRAAKVHVDVKVTPISTQRSNIGRKMKKVREGA